MEHFTNPDLFSHLLPDLGVSEIYSLSLVNKSFSKICLKALKDIDKSPIAKEWAADLITYLLLDKENCADSWCSGVRIQTCIYTEAHIALESSIDTYTGNKYYIWRPYFTLRRDLFDLFTDKGTNPITSKYLEYDQFIEMYYPIVKNVVIEESYIIRLLESSRLGKISYVLRTLDKTVGYKGFIHIIENILKVTNNNKNFFGITKEWLESLYQSNESMLKLFKRFWNLLVKIEEEKNIESSHINKRQKIFK